MFKNHSSLVQWTSDGADGYSAASLPGFFTANDELSGPGSPGTDGSIFENPTALAFNEFGETSANAFACGAGLCFVDESGVTRPIVLFAPLQALGVRAFLLTATTTQAVAARYAGRFTARTLTSVAGTTVASTTTAVLKGQKPLSALTQSQRTVAAQWYRGFAGRATGKFTDAARAFNIARAEFLEGARATIPSTLTEFMRLQK